MSRKKKKLLFPDGEDSNQEWDFETLQKIIDAAGVIAHEDLGLTTFPIQVEIISSEQMLDAHATMGMPVSYKHWVYGKRFLQEEKIYRKGFSGLAYEIVINSDPCIAYCMEQNTVATQALVIAHAAFGHNHFFRNNYLYEMWSDADGILRYMEFARDFIARQEALYGAERVEKILDAAHALTDHGVFRVRKKRHGALSFEDEVQQEIARQEEAVRHYNVLWSTVPKGRGRKKKSAEEKEYQRRLSRLGMPEENLLYFIEKNSPKLETWEREILRIVRNIAQYFYPQKQTRVMNEGFACFVHYYILYELYEKGLIGEGTMLEALHLHSNVVAQPDFDDSRYRGVNPYALGFAMFRDIARVATEPTEEDREWFAGDDFVGCGDWRATVKYAVRNFRDRSFVKQYLSPKLMRDMHMFAMLDEADDTHFTVESIHNGERGYRNIRKILAEQFDIQVWEPNIQVSDVRLRGDRKLHLVHWVTNGMPLAPRQRDEVLRHIYFLWGYDVELNSTDRETEKVLQSTTVDEAFLEDMAADKADEEEDDDDGDDKDMG